MPEWCKLTKLLNEWEPIIIFCLFKILLWRNKRVQPVLIQERLQLKVRQFLMCIFFTFFQLSAVLRLLNDCIYFLENFLDIRILFWDEKNREFFRFLNRLTKLFFVVVTKMCKFTSVYVRTYIFCNLYSFQHWSKYTLEPYFRFFYSSVRFRSIKCKMQVRYVRLQSLN